MPKLRIRLLYFNSMGRAEVSRIALDLGGIAFEGLLISDTGKPFAMQDCRVTMDNWPHIKPKTPYGQLPVLEVDGKMVAQSAAVSRYCAKLAGLVPSDDFQAALCDEVYDVVQDIQALMYPTIFEMEECERLEARKKLIKGTLTDKLDALDKRLADIAGDKFVGGDKPSHGDLAVYGMCAWLTSGILEGVPQDLMKPYRHICALRNRVASVPVIKARYEGKDDVMSKAMMPSAA